MKKQLTLFVVLLITFFAGCSTSKLVEENKGTQSTMSFTTEYKATINTNYLLYLPDDYGKEDKQWPLVLFLHGAGERGKDINLVTKHGPPKQAAAGRKFPFILVSPQCPDYAWWSYDIQIDILNTLLDDIQSNYKVDPDRIYITGISMGGFGTWKMLEKYPYRFAAAIPICGGGDSTTACSFKDVPIWAFHGGKDYVVPIERSQSMIRALKTCNGNPEFTIYPEAGHDSWTKTYDNPEVYEWMLKQVRK